MSKLNPILASPEVRNLYTLLGFTLGNSSELALMQSLSAGTRPGDYVLFDVRLHRYGVVDQRTFDVSDEGREALVAPYDTEALAAFAFSPVEEASDYAVRLEDESISIRLTPHWGSGFTVSRLYHQPSMYTSSASDFTTTSRFSARCAWRGACVRIPS